MSDQDFFFDEEDETADKADAAGKAEKQAKPSKSSSSTKTTSDRPRRDVAPVATGSFFDRSTTMAVASLVGVIGLLLGVIGGFLLSDALAGPELPPAVSGTGTGAGTLPSTAATGDPGALSPEQLQGGLPQGHPDIGGAGMGGSGEATGQGGGNK